MVVPPLKFQLLHWINAVNGAKTACIAVISFLAGAYVCTSEIAKVEWLCCTRSLTAGSNLMDKKGGRQANKLR